MTAVENRRPLSVREWNIIRRSASWLCRKNITPNQISLASVVFAVLAGLLASRMYGASNPALFFLATASVLCMLGRALCNIFDGMVAIEGGKSTKSGELFNDIPDRLSDAFFCVSIGYACANYPYGIELGWSAALLAVMTAYIRYVGRAAGAPSDFRGPMAKTHRVFILCAGILLTPVEYMFGSYGGALIIALVIINVGCIITCARRAVGAYCFIEGK